MKYANAAGIILFENNFNIYSFAAQNKKLKKWTYLIKELPHQVLLVIIWMLLMVITCSQS